MCRSSSKAAAFKNGSSSTANTCSINLVQKKGNAMVASKYFIVLTRPGHF